MRRQDEILEGYSQTGPEGQRFLLSQLDEAILYFDHPRLLPFLEPCMASADPWVAYLSGMDRLAIESEATGRDFGFRLGSNETWSHFHGDRCNLRAATVPRARLTAIRKTATALLEPLVAPLVGLARPGNPLATEAILCLAGIPCALAIDHLASLVRVPETAGLAILALTRSGSAAAVRACLEAIAALEALSPQAVAALRFLPWAGRSQVVGRAIRGGGDPLGPALAVGGIPGAEGLALVEELLRTPDPWVRAHALRSLALQGHGLETARAAYERESDPAIKVQAVSAMVQTGLPEAARYLVDLLPSAPPQVQSKMIRGLTVLDSPEVGPEIRRHVRPLLHSPDPTIRVPAILLVAPEDPAQVIEPLAELLSSADPGVRREGVFCLGFLPLPSVSRSLGDLLAGDPCPEVAYEALASLSRHPLHQSFDPMVQAFTRSDERIVTGVLWAFGDLEAGATPQMVARMNPSVDSAPHRPPLCERLRFAGKLAGFTGQETLLKEPLESLRAADPDVRTAAVDALILAGVSASSVRIGDVEAGASGALRARLLLLRLLSGDLDAAAGFAPLLASPAALPAIRTVTQFQSLLAHVGPSRRFAALERRLSEGAEESRQPEPADEAAVVRSPAPPRQVLDETGTSVRPVELRSDDAFSHHLGRVTRRVPVHARPPSVLNELGDRLRSRLPAARLFKVLAPVVLGLAVIVLAVLSRRPDGPPEPPLPSESPLGPMAGLRVVSVVAGADERYPEVGEPLARGTPFKTAGSLTLATPFPSCTFFAHPGGGQLLDLVALPANAGGYSIDLRLEPGEYRLDARPGGSRFLIRTSWGEIKAEQARLELSLEAAAATLEVEHGTVEITPRATKPVTLVGPARWRGP